jgi:hypothetical protein
LVKGKRLKEDSMSRTIRTLAILAVTAAVSASVGVAQVKKAEEVYKDIEVLKGMPSDQLNATMQFFEASLGVGCDYCHAPDRDKDTERKDVARKMVEMVKAVNRDTFEGDTEVTCYTCHRGQVQPPENPGLANAEYRGWEPDSPNGLPNAAPVAGPPPAQIIDKWIGTLGGMDVVNKITSRVVKGTVTNSVGASQPVEIVSKGDNALVINGNAIIARNGKNGWFRQGNGNPRDIRNYEFNTSRGQDLLFIAKNVKALSRLETRQGEIGDRPVYEVRGVSEDGVPVRLFFGRETGNLLRLVWLTPNAVGQNITRIDFSDFREVNDTKYPFRWVVRTPLSYQIMRVDSVQQNAAVEDSRFARPAAR